MTRPIPECVPATLTAGDRWQFRLSFADFPASTASLAVVLNGVAATVTLDVAADGDAFVVGKAAADTADVVAGPYRYAARATLGDDVQTVRSGLVMVAADLATADAGALQTYAERQLADWKTKYEALSLVKKYGIANRELERHSELEIRAALAHWSRVVAKERRQGQPKQYGVTF